MSDATFDFDLFVIGAGSGGVRAARVAAQHGARVAVAEEYRVGGTCVIRGCVPKKLLVYGAHFAHELADAAKMGWTIEGARFDWATLRDNVQADVARLEGMYTQTLTNNHVERFLERATIAGPNRVKLASGREITAAHILIAVGAWPVLPDCPGSDLALTSNEVFHLPSLPRRIVIQGAGYIAMEFAGVFNALGSEVIVVNRSDKILRGYDASVTDRLLQITKSRGIQYRFNSPICGLEKAGDCFTVSLAGGEAPLTADAVLIATGRQPKTAGLGLETVGLALGVHGEIPVLDAAGRTAIAGIHAVGDVTDRVQLTPVAIREGQAFADSVFGGREVAVAYDHIPSAVFSQPPIGAVGLTEAAAIAAGFAVDVFTSDFRPMRNVLSPHPERGLYKLVVDAKTGRMLGVHMIGPEAPEIAQVAAIAVKAGLTKADFDATVALHPSMAEELVLMR